MKQLDDSMWSQAVRKDKVVPRSYEVQRNNQTYHHNHQDLRPTPDDIPFEPTFDVTTNGTQKTDSRMVLQIMQQEPKQLNIESTDI